MENKDDELLELLRILKEEEIKEQESPNIEKETSKFRNFIKFVKEKAWKNRLKEILRYSISICMIIYMIFTIFLNMMVTTGTGGNYNDDKVELKLSNITGHWDYKVTSITKNKIIVYIIQIVCIIGIIKIPKYRKKGFICIIALFVICNVIIFFIPVQIVEAYSYRYTSGTKNIYGITFEFWNQ